ncbi:MAG: zinc-dependent metalloprotease [Salinibacter sp.]
MRHLTIFALCALLLTSCSLFRESTEAPSTSTTNTEKDDDPFEPWEKTLEDTRKIEGFIPMHQKKDRTLYAELTPEQLGTNFGLVLHISKGVGVFNLHNGLRLTDTRMMRFRRVGNKVHLVHRNVRFRADEGGMRTSMKENLGHSVVHSFDIVSKNDSTGALLVKLSDFLVSDYARIGERIKPYFNQKPTRLQDDKSYVEQVRGFAKNVEIDAMLNYQGSEPPIVGGEAIPDFRSVPVGVRYSFFQLPKDPMQARAADDRVGYFVDAIKDFSRDRQADPFLRYVNRWRLAPSDTAAYRRGELVEPEEPIVYYVDHTVPDQYRPHVKAGIEAWNKAFEKAGYKNAVVAKDAPDDSSWSAEDIRHSTVQWTASHRMGYAIGPSQTDPRTGEILNADILISSAFVRGWQQTYSNLTPGADAGGSRLDRSLRRTERALDRMFPPRLARRACFAERRRARQIGLQRAVLLARGRINPGAPMPEKYLGGAIKDLVMHEVGHTLGLRHNFKASSGIPTEKLHDESYTRKHGVSLSVMDYAPVNVALDASEQGHYWNPTVGSYDEWAIKYGYMPIAKQGEEGPLTRDGPLADTTATEENGLNKIAAQSSDPMHTYGTDEDARLGAYAVDPLTNTGELGSNPLAFAASRAALVQTVKPKLDERLIAEGERYHRLREATTALILERYRSLQPITKMVGGMYVSRDHKGTPDARMPFRPVAPERQRKAVDMLIEQAFAPDAFTFTAERLNKLAPNRRSYWDISVTLQLDYPVHEYVSTVQTGLLNDLLHPARLQRMIDNQVRTDAAYGPGDLMPRLTDAIWSELDTRPPRALSINSFRRNLQRVYTDRLIDFLLDTTSWITITPSAADQVTVPEDVRSLARLELTELSDRIGQALDRDGLDRTTRAHLSETKARIDRALEASVRVTP